MIGTKYTTQLELVEVQCPECGALYAIAQHRDARIRQKGGTTTCPSGHTWSYDETEITTVRRERDEQAAMLDKTQRELRTAIASGDLEHQARLQLIRDRDHDRARAKVREAQKRKAARAKAKRKR